MQLIAGFEEMFSEVPQEKWEQWFNDWFVHLNKCIDSGGKYFDKVKKKKIACTTRLKKQPW